jgi:putative acetyltransferase
MAAILYRRSVLIRDEAPPDHGAVAEIHRQAFGPDGPSVAALVQDLRASLQLEPGLSVVAEDEEHGLVGHVLFTRNLLDAPERLVDVQVLSPVGVRPDRQRTGVGTALIRHGLDVLAGRGVPLVFLEGSPAYYSRFGFVAGRSCHFRRPSLRIPVAAFQVRLLATYEPWMSGTLVYRREFWDHDTVGLRGAAQSG